MASPGARRMIFYNVFGYHEQQEEVARPLASRSHLLMSKQSRTLCSDITVLEEDLDALDVPACSAIVPHYCIPL